MKVLTLTTQYANNMGAQLQCYALSRYLKENEHVDCEVLDYRPIGADKSWTFFYKPRTFRDFLKLSYSLLNVNLLRQKLKERSMMREFINKYIPVTTENYDRRRIENNPPQADAFIVGSDQIWNFKYRLDLTYFLDFVDKSKSKIIAYAPSIADPWEEDKAQYIKPYLERFDFLSIRENANLAQVSTLSPANNPVVVSDPVFLLKKEQWNSIASHKYCIDEPYIFCYFLSVTPDAVEAVRKLREETRMKVVHFNLNALDKFNSNYNIHRGNPADFIGLISHATYVCTNSFHCSAFSIIYERNFLFVPKGMANERISNLVERFGLSDVFLNAKKLKSLTKRDFVVDYSTAHQKGQEFVDFARKYLHNALFSDSSDK